MTDRKNEKLIHQLIDQVLNRKAMEYMFNEIAKCQIFEEMDPTEKLVFIDLIHDGLRLYFEGCAKQIGHDGKNILH